MNQLSVIKCAVKARVRYWEDSQVNGADDTEGTNVPCRDGDLWRPIINVVTGVIENWETGKTASIHYKVSDRCGWDLLDAEGNVITSETDGYVPDCLSPAAKGYGDYIIMNIDESGKIDKWNFDLGDFQTDDDY